jgi:hypothetical protein
MSSDEVGLPLGVLFSCVARVGLCINSDRIGMKFYAHLDASGPELLETLNCIGRRDCCSLKNDASVFSSRPD